METCENMDKGACPTWFNEKRRQCAEWPPLSWLYGIVKVKHELTNTTKTFWLNLSHLTFSTYFRCIWHRLHVKDSTGGCAGQDRGNPQIRLQDKCKVKGYYSIILMFICLSWCHLCYFINYKVTCKFVGLS